MRLFSIVVATVLFSSLTAHGGQTQEFNFEKMIGVLRKVQNLEKLPPRVTESDSEDPADKSIPLSVTKFFDKSLRFVFNKPLGISLKSCKDCDAMADYGLATVYLQPSFLDSLKEYGPESDRLVQLIVLHEISHFVHEVSIVHGKTVNGNISLYVRTPGDPTTDFKESFERAGRSHHEVDAYAMLLAKQMGLPKPEIVVKMFEQFIEEAKLGEKDEYYELILDESIARAESARRVIERLWN